MAQTYEEHLAKSEECRKRTHDNRVRWGLCVRCGKKLTDEKTLQCKNCLAKDAERRKLNREKNLEYQRRRVADHRARGLCLFCNDPAVTKTRCEYHRKYLKVMNSKRKKKTEVTENDT